VPAKWRPAAPNTELTLILWPKPKEGPCLRVLPPKKMADLMRDIDAMPNSDPNKVVLKRFIGSESVQVALDKAGRICLPEEMAAVAGIKDEAVLVDRKSTRLNSSHVEISYAVFCLKKKRCSMKQRNMIDIKS